MPGVQPSTVFSACSLPDVLLENVLVLYSHAVNPFSQTHQVLQIFQTPDWTFAMEYFKDEKVRQFLLSKTVKV